MSGPRGFLGRFARNRPALLGVIALGIILAGAVVGPLLYPVDPFEMVGRPFQLPFGRFLLLPYAQELIFFKLFLFQLAILLFF